MRREHRRGDTWGLGGIGRRETVVMMEIYIAKHTETKRQRDNGRENRERRERVR